MKQISKIILKTLNIRKSEFWTSDLQSVAIRSIGSSTFYIPLSTTNNYLLLAVPLA